VFAMVPLLVGQAEEALLEDRVVLVPERDGQTDVLEAVAEPGESIFVPAIGAAASVIVGEEAPGIAMGAVVLADGAPGPFGEVGPAAFPVGAARRTLAQAAVLGGRGLRHGQGLRPAGEEDREVRAGEQYGMRWIRTPGSRPWRRREGSSSPLSCAG